MEYQEANNIPLKNNRQTLNRLICSFKSDFPNEIDFAMQVSTILANSNNFIWSEDYQLIDAICQSLHVFSCLCGHSINCYCYPRFWHKLINSNIDNVYLQEATMSQDIEFLYFDFNSLKDLNIDDHNKIYRRVKLVAELILQFSMTAGVAKEPKSEYYVKKKVKASPALLKFVSLLYHCDDKTLNLIGLEILSNIGSKLSKILDDVTCTKLVHMFEEKCVNTIYQDGDICLIKLSMEVVSKLISSSSRAVTFNVVSLISKKYIVPRLEQLLTSHHDVRLFLSALELCHSLSSYQPQVLTDTKYLLKILLNLLSCDGTRYFTKPALKRVKLSGQPIGGLTMITNATRPLIATTTNKAASANQTAVPSASTQPKVAPASTQPAIAHTQTQPSVTPAQTKPVVGSATSQQIVGTTQIQPTETSAQNQPAVASAQTEPLVTHAQIQPAVQNSNQTVDAKPTKQVTVSAPTQSEVETNAPTSQAAPTTNLTIEAPIPKEPAALPNSTQISGTPTLTPSPTVQTSNQPVIASAPTQPAISPSLAQAPVASDPHQSADSPVPTITSTQTKVISNSAQLTVPHVPKYRCRWNGCDTDFIDPKDVYKHVFTQHVGSMPADTLSSCLWSGPQGAGPGCLTKRPKFSLLTHLNDFHCNLTALNRAQPIQPPEHPGYSPNAAVLAIKRHTHQQKVPIQHQSILSTSVRLTAAMIVRNLARESRFIKQSLESYESLLSEISMSGGDEAKIVAECLSLICEKNNNV